MVTRFFSFLVLSLLYTCVHGTQQDVPNPYCYRAGSPNCVLRETRLANKWVQAIKNKNIRNVRRFAEWGGSHIANFRSCKKSTDFDSDYVCPGTIQCCLEWGVTPVQAALADRDAAVMRIMIKAGIITMEQAGISSLKELK